MAATDLYALSHILHADLVIHELLRKVWICGPDVGLGVNVVRAYIVSASLGKRKVELKLPDFRGQGIGGKS